MKRIGRLGVSLFFLLLNILYFTQCKEEVYNNFIQHYYIIDSISNDKVIEFENSLYADFKISYSRVSESEVDSMRNLYGDNHYNSIYNYEEFVYVNHLDSIHIVSDSDFDIEHPTGVLLDDLFYLSYYSYYDYLMSNYGRDRVHERSFSKKISEFKYDDGHLINSFRLFIQKDISSIAKEHNLTITIYFSNLKPQVVKQKILFD